MPLASKVKAKMLRRLPRVKLKIKKGDTVMVISGKDKGKRGVVSLVNPEKQTVIVDGVNLVTKHQRGRPSPMGGTPIQGGRIEKPAPLHISKVMLIDPHSDKPTRVGRKMVDGKLVRYAKVSGEVIDA